MAPHKCLRTTASLTFTGTAVMPLPWKYPSHDLALASRIECPWHVVLIPISGAVSISCPG